MSGIIRAFGLALAPLLGALGGCAAAPEAALAPGKTFDIRGRYFEACGCRVGACACMVKDRSTADTNAHHCQVLSVYQINTGTAFGTKLDGLKFAMAITESGENMSESLGKWQGVMYIDEHAEPAQRKALLDAIGQSAKGVFAAPPAVHTAKIDFEETPDKLTAKVGGVIDAEIVPVRNAEGRPTTYTHLPFPPPFTASYPVHLAKSAKAVYNGDTAKWDRPGRNALYADFRIAD